MSFKYLLITVIAVTFIIEFILEWLNERNRSTFVPDELQQYYDTNAAEKSLNYESAKTRLSRITSFITTAVLLLLIITDSFAKLDQWVISHTSGLLSHTLLFFGILMFAGEILSVPVSLYRNFRIEEKYGFNRMSAATWIKDKLRSYLITVLLGGSLLAMFVLFYQITGSNFWWIAWIAISMVMLFAAMFYASLILPLYNKLQPLPEGELRTELQAYCSRVKFPMKDIFIMDGSKRSGKANAFFSGMGSQRKIVLFDTLVNNHSVQELIAVMAHEVGHYKKKHTTKMIVAGIFQTGIMLFLFSLTVNSTVLSHSLGSEVWSLPLSMLAFGLLYSPVSFVTGIITNSLSRRHEFEADEFAAHTYSAQHLNDALMRLSSDQLSNLHPHPLFVKVYYSHPPVLLRAAALKALT